MNLLDQIAYLVKHPTVMKEISQHIAKELPSARAALREQATQLKTFFECEECSHEWNGKAGPTGHAWDTCPNCGADDGQNCWDCGINVVEEGDGGEMCTACHRTLCWDCTGGRLRAYRSPHEGGRVEDKGRCGATARIL